MRLAVQQQVKLQIAPPNLTYTRELRLSASVVLSIIPRSTGMEVIQERGQLFILTDLFLIGERMTREESSRFGPGGPDTWLLYPPLAGKHLRVEPVDGSGQCTSRCCLPSLISHLCPDFALNVTILKKEVLTVTADSPRLRDKLLRELRECIETGASGKFKYCV